MSTVPIESLQLRALEQRSQLHKTASDLREKIEHTREKLRFSKQARDHLVTASVLAGLVGLAAGYSMASRFTYH
jgi:C4-dicarboxylate-specific signal transduction histidine kinase